MQISFLASTTAAKKKEYISTKKIPFLQDHTILFITQVMFKFVIYLFTFIAFANANYTTWSLVTDYTTYCPQSTEITVNNSIITITGPTTLTITGECTLDYVATVEAAPSSIPSNVTVIESNGASKLNLRSLAGAGLIAAIFIAFI